MKVRLDGGSDRVDCQGISTKNQFYDWLAEYDAEFNAESTKFSAEFAGLTELSAK